MDIVNQLIFDVLVVSPQYNVVKLVQKLNLTLGKVRQPKVTHGRLFVAPQSHTFNHFISNKDFFLVFNRMRYSESDDYYYNPNVPLSHNNSDYSFKHTMWTILAEYLTTLFAQIFKED